MKIPSRKNQSQLIFRKVVTWKNYNFYFSRWDCKIFANCDEKNSTNLIFQRKLKLIKRSETVKNQVIGYLYRLLRKNLWTWTRKYFDLLSLLNLLLKLWMKAYSNMETGYINEGEFSNFFLLWKIFYFYLCLNKKKSSPRGLWNEWDRKFFLTRSKVK